MWAHFTFAHTVESKKNAKFSPSKLRHVGNLNQLSDVLYFKLFSTSVEAERTLGIKARSKSAPFKGLRMGRADTRLPAQHLAAGHRAPKSLLCPQRPCAHPKEKSTAEASHTV